MISINKNACRTLWQTYLGTLPEGHPHHSAMPNAFGFGGEPQLADELAGLALAGKKRATTSLPLEYTTLDLPVPQRGDLSIIVDGRGSPVAVIERTEVIELAFAEVDAEYAAAEGEGDGSLRHWQQAHAEYFNGVCARLGGSFSAATPVLCQHFRIVWRP